MFQESHVFVVIKNKKINDFIAFEWMSTASWHDFC